MKGRTEGFDELLAACRATNHEATLGPPCPNPEASWQELGVAPDADLVAIHKRCDGASLWQLRLHPARRMAETTLERREGRPGLAFLGDVVFFAKFDLLAHHLVTVPSLADEEDHQPVLYVDLHETPLVLPIASSVDRCFQLLAEHVSTHAAPPDEEDDPPFFPESVARQLAGDTALRKLAHTPILQRILRESRRTPGWTA